ncbi:DUF805 domain-containing protein [Mesobacillus subterraneus]|uniref:DUF805 domain-containing protein n=1 Tax=Mesobacillus subterraneus TaxID=285983 RepID=A0A427TVI3_9BACI|nr:DUF805 domain-containing protein [Mesobacillus subterraneus]RSD28497.1 DUF805 domain-containing protein [Mesobacillus subterraneus]
MYWYLKPFKQYADFTGRARRKEYWIFALFNTIILFALSFLGEFVELFGYLLVIYNLAVIVPSLAVTARRLHDTGRSGWWQLISLIPIAGGIVLLVFLCFDSVNGENKYGPNPKQAIDDKDGDLQLNS